MTSIEWTDATRGRFWSNVDRSGGPDACWLWTAGLFTSGYGQFRVGARKVRAHRAALDLSGVTLAPGQLACHRCDTPRCCNPSHLFVGSAADNARDRDQKGRARHGEGPRPKTRGSGNHAAKLTQRDVDCIRDMAMVGVRQRDIAERFGVSQSQVGNIVRGKCWAT